MITVGHPWDMCAPQAWVLGQIHSARYVFSSCGTDFKFNETSVGYAHIVHATFVPVGIFNGTGHCGVHSWEGH